MSPVACWSSSLSSLSISKQKIGLILHPTQSCHSKCLFSPRIPPLPVMFSCLLELYRGSTSKLGRLTAAFAQSSPGASPSPFIFCQKLILHGESEPRPEGFCINLDKSKINNLGARTTEGSAARGGVHVPGFEPSPPCPVGAGRVGSRLVWPRVLGHMEQPRRTCHHRQPLWQHPGCYKL